MIRAWGAGMPEKNDFYELCDQYGIMVMQEWTHCLDSHLTQPYAMAGRNRSIQYAAHPQPPQPDPLLPGNESANPFGEAIDMMGRYATELDGTLLPFHRGEPWAAPGTTMTPTGAARVWTCSSIWKPNSSANSHRLHTLCGIGEPLFARR